MRRFAVSALTFFLVAIQPTVAGDNLTQGTAATPAGGSSQVVTDLHAGLLDIMQRAGELGFTGRAEIIGPIVEDSFDIEVIAGSAIGLSIWRSWDETQKETYKDAFGRFLTANYAHQFDAFSGQGFEWVSSKPGPKETHLVKTLLTRPEKEPVDLTYLVRLRQGEPGIIDVYSAGSVSEAARRRSEFVAIYRDAGFDGLISSIESQILDLELSNDV